MYNLTAYINTPAGGPQTRYVETPQKMTDDVTAVYIRGVSKFPIDGEFGAAIEFEIPGMKRWMANTRHSEFWCSPVFGEKYSDIPDETQGFIYEKENGEFGVIIPVVSESYKCVLCGAENAICAKLFCGKSRSFEHIIKSVISERCEVEFFTYLIKHFLISLTVRVCIFIINFIRHIFALKLGYYTSCNKHFFI